LAHYFAIATVSATLRGLLADARPQPEFGAAEIKLLQVPDFQGPRPLEEGVSITLYRTTASGAHRGLTAGFDARGHRRPPALMVDLHYLLTAWGRTAEKQQRLLGWMLRTMEDTPTLGAALLNHYGGPEPIFEEQESVTVIYDPLSLPDLSSVWDVLKPNVHVSATYIARMVPLESPLTTFEAEPVQTRELQYVRQAT
jgi:hypothetical protein